MFVLVLLIPFLFMFMRKHVHVISVIQFLHLHSSLLPLYVPLLDNSVMTLMLFDEIKSFTFITSMSLQELYLFA